MKSEENKELLRRYLAGKSNAEERALVERWYQHLQNEKSATMGQQQEQQLKDEIWQQLRSKMPAPERNTKAFSASWWRAAAAVFLVTCVGIFFYMRGKLSQAGRSAERQMVSVVTRAGERRIVVLRDSSILSIKGGSSIRINRDLANSRIVEIIDGEVFFEIKQDPSKPFVVKSGPLQTRVLGTSFNIRAYDALSQFAVSVTSGKVQVSANGMQGEVLGKNRQLVYDREKRQVAVVTNEAIGNNWGKDLFVLDNASFDEVALLLNKNYGIHINTTDDHLRTKRFTATLKNTMSATEVLEVLAAVHKLKVKKRRDYIEIYK
ncbi:FecR family protein [Olivibacter sp. XZL3]|uniref:FecR family protein n=1 Tax=Olivibacter sp. XZL3 TaxID=1735116 RepID=UPI0010656ECC|nr:FecR domain-containing protein [Olivibacter sp. XZL3]